LDLKILFRAYFHNLILVN